MILLNARNDFNMPGENSTIPAGIHVTLIVLFA